MWALFLLISCSRTVRRLLILSGLLAVFALAEDARAQTVVRPPLQTQPDPPEPPEPPQARPAARSHAFLGKPEAGSFDPEPYNLWYVQREEKVNLKFLPDVHYPNGGDLLWGQLSDLLFTGYKWLVHGVLALVGSIVFGLAFVVWLLDPALELGDRLQREIVGPFELWKLVAALGAVFFGWAWYGLARPGAATVEAGLTAALIASMGLFVPADAARWVISAVGNSSAVVLMAGSGGDPRAEAMGGPLEDPAMVPGPSTRRPDGELLSRAFRSYMGDLERTAIATPAELLTFGERLPEECRAAYETGVDQRLTTNDVENFTPLMQAGQGECQKYVAQAVQPDAGRAWWTWVTFLGGVAFSISVLVMAWPALAGMVRFMGAVATHKLLLLGLALPGSLRAGALRVLLLALLGVCSLLLVALAFVLVLVFMRAVLESSTGPESFGLRLIAAFLVPVAGVFGVRRAQRASKARAERAARRSSTTQRPARGAAPGAQPDPVAAKARRSFTRDVATLVTARKLYDRTGHRTRGAHGPGSGRPNAQPDTPASGPAGGGRWWRRRGGPDAGGGKPGGGRGRPRPTGQRSQGPGTWPVPKVDQPGVRPEDLTVRDWAAPAPGARPPAPAPAPTSAGPELWTPGTGESVRHAMARARERARTLRGA